VTCRIELIGTVCDINVQVQLVDDNGATTTYRIDDDEEELLKKRKRMGLRSIKEMRSLAGARDSDESRATGTFFFITFFLYTNDHLLIHSYRCT
jgi:hypothetical protein